MIGMQLGHSVSLTIGGGRRQADVLRNSAPQRGMTVSAAVSRRSERIKED